MLLDTSKFNLHTRIMTLADKLTSARLVMAPVFFIIFLSFGGKAWTIPVLWVIFVLSEITDMLDGMVARKQGEVSDFGRLFDPFADTLTQITYFLCFVIDGIFPAVIFLIVLYREFTILFLRNLMLKKGITMGARMSGKVKTVSYIIAGGLALLASSMIRLGFDSKLCRWFILSAQAVFAFSMVISVISFFDYFGVFLKTPGNS